jgi:hypothetical protein
VLLRNILQVALRHNIDGHVPFAGVLVLIVEIPTSMPPFYVLSATEGWGAFFFSAFACVVTETLCADTELRLGFHTEGFTVSVFADRRADYYPYHQDGPVNARRRRTSLCSWRQEFSFFSSVIPQAVYRPWENPTASRAGGTHHLG